MLGCVLVLLMLPFLMLAVDPHNQHVYRRVPRVLTLRPDEALRKKESANEQYQCARHLRCHEQVL